MDFHIADTETADMNGGVCDVAIICVDENLNEKWRMESLVDPERPISPGASGVHGIVDEMVEFEPTLSEWSNMHGHPFKRDDLIIVGHNIQFDCRMLHEVMPEVYRRLCTLKLAKLLWPDLENHKLQTLRYAFRLEAGDAHRAMGDVITCYSLLRRACDELKTDLPGLMQFVRKPLPPSTKIGFGKHRGTPIKDLPRSYVDWLLTKCETLDEDLRDALQAM